MGELGKMPCAAGRPSVATACRCSAAAGVPLASGAGMSAGGMLRCCWWFGMLLLFIKDEANHHNCKVQLDRNGDGK